MPGARVTVTDAFTEAEQDQLKKLIGWLAELGWTGNSGKMEFNGKLWRPMHDKLKVATAVTIVREIP